MELEEASIQNQNSWNYHTILITWYWYSWWKNHAPFGKPIKCFDTEISGADLFSPTVPLFASQTSSMWTPHRAVPCLLGLHNADLDWSHCWKHHSGLQPESRWQVELHLARNWFIMLTEKYCPLWVPKMLVSNPLYQDLFGHPKWCRMFSINCIMIYKIEENTFQKRNDDVQWKLDDVLMDYDVWQRLQNGLDEDHQERNSWPLQTKTISP